jgi:hypothetical protein
MALTLGFTGMDSATEAALTAAFEQANARLGKSWQLQPEVEAAHVIVDMDSMYGPMSWLRLHAASKQVIGLTSAPRTQANFHLSRPFDAESVATLLQAIASDAGVPVQPTPLPEARLPETRRPEAEPRPAKAPVPSGMSQSPAPQDLLLEEHPLPVDEEAKAPAPAPGLPGSVEAGTLAPTTIAPSPAAPEPASPEIPEPTVVTPAPPRERGLADWLAPGALSGRLRYRPASGESVLIDADARQYFATAALKPLAATLDGVVASKDFEPIDMATWARETSTLGPAQPLGRLQWYGGLLAGKGVLLPEFDPAGRYKLSKWPQTEREFPKHFRIATAMMKGPATLDEITAASGVPSTDVIDFVNASLVTGFAEFVPEPSAEPAEPQKPGGLFGRLRGK